MVLKMLCPAQVQAIVDQHHDMKTATKVRFQEPSNGKTPGNNKENLVLFIIFFATELFVLVLLVVVTHLWFFPPNFSKTKAMMKLLKNVILHKHAINPHHKMYLQQFQSLKSQVLLRK